MGISQMVSNEFIDVIDWLQTDEETMVYRFPRFRSEIKYGAKLTVREGQQAILVNEGKIADVFQPGIYELKTSNLPILSTLQHWHHGFESPFKADIYFFNTTLFLNQKWGTKQPIILNDEKFGIVRLRAFGSYTLRVAEPQVLLTTLVGTDGNFEVNEVNDQITNAIASRFPEVLIDGKISVMELPMRYSELAERIKNYLDADCVNYGLEIGQILLESVSLPENVQKIVDEKTSMNIIGDDMNTYTQMQMAKSMGNGGGETGSMASAGAGMAMGMEMGRQMAESMRAQAPAPQAQPEPQTPPPAPEADEPPPPPPSTGPSIYYLMLMGERVGPMPIEEVYNYLTSGQADSGTLVWRKGMGNWQPINTLSEIDLSIVPPPLPPA